MFKFKYFSIKQSDSAMKVGTDSMLLGAFIESEHATRGLDIGSGTGVLSLMVAQQNSTICIDAVEIDGLASKECKHNFEKSIWSERLNCVNEDFADFKSGEKYDLIFSNPPYYTTRNPNQDFRKATARHENNLPLDILLTTVKHHLLENGNLWLILPSQDFNKWNLFANKIELYCSRRIDVKGKLSKPINRVICCFGNHKNSMIEQEFILRNEDNSYTDEYISLTKEFHGVPLK